MSGVVLRTLDQLSAQDVEDWRTLDAEQSGLGNPFCSPDWVRQWYASFAPQPRSQLIALVRANDRLVGVAPFYWSEVALGPMRFARRLRLVGAGQGSALLELPQVLCADGHGRSVLRQLVESVFADPEVCSSRSWVELSLAPGQGWFEPQWLHAAAGRAAFHRHQATRACVVLPLRPTWTETLGGLKRNVKESLRRSRNRLAKLDMPAEVASRSVDLDTATVDRFLRLHSSRADQTDREVHHDAFSDAARRDFLRELLPVLGQRDRARILELTVGERQVAALLVLRAAGTTYIHSSGFLPEFWELAPVTYLQERAFADACTDGHAYVNLSPGPNLAKLRWSERVDTYDDFAFGSGSSPLLWLYSAYAALAVRKEVLHVARMRERRRTNQSPRPQQGPDHHRSA